MNSNSWEKCFRLGQSTGAFMEGKEWDERRGGEREEEDKNTCLYSVLLGSAWEIGLLESVSTASLDPSGTLPTLEGIQGRTEKVSLFCLPSDGVLREKWKRLIPRQETGDFCFDSKYVRVCEKHFDDSDIIRADEFVVNGEKVSLPRDKPLLKPCAIPRKFDGLPAYLTKPKQRSRTLTRRSPAKRRRESSSCARKTEVHAKPGTSGAASCDEDLALPTDLVGEGPTRTSDSACQTDEFTSPLAEVKLLKCQLRATKQQLILCHTKLAKMRVQASKHKKLEESLQKMSTRTKLIFDQGVMKANEVTLLQLLPMSPLEASPETTLA
nr:uncharacterized protein LOC119165068 [Rhipicephalus microplus]